MTALHWPEGKRGAVSLTYDDALPVHYEHVAPLLEEHGLRATFYTNVLSLGANPEAWRQVAARGHELGNHSIFHPCRKSPRHGWLDEAYDLKTYTPRRWTDEMRAADIVLNLVDGRTKRSFGNTCCNTEIGEGETTHSLEPLIDELFVAGRGRCVIAPSRPTGSTWPRSDTLAATHAPLMRCAKKSRRALRWAGGLFT